MQRWGFLLIASVMLISQVSNINAVRNENSKTVFIFSPYENDDEYTNYVLDFVKENLDVFGINIVHQKFPHSELEQPDDPVKKAYHEARLESPTIWLDLVEYNLHANDLNNYIRIGIRPDSLKLPITDISPILIGTEDELTFSFGLQTNYPMFEPSGGQFVSDYVTGIALYLTNHCEQAISFFQSALKQFEEIQYPYKDPRPTLTIPFYIATCTLITGDADNAMQSYETLIRWGDSPNDNRVLVSDSIPAAINLSWLYINTDRTTDGFELIDSAIETIQFSVGKCHDDDASCFDPLVNILSRRAQLYALAERYGDAIADLTTAIDLPAEDTPDLYILRGQMYLALYEWDRALADYNMAIELDPDYADAYYERSVLYYSILQTGVELRTDALADFQKYLELAPDGEKAADAARYVEQIETELEALNG